MNDAKVVVLKEENRNLVAINKKSQMLAEAMKRMDILEDKLAAERKDHLNAMKRIAELEDKLVEAMNKIALYEFQYAIIQHLNVHRCAQKFSMSKSRDRE